MFRSFSRFIVSVSPVLLLLIWCGNPCFSQQQDVVPYIQSPNAQGLGSYGKFDVSPFTGMANISIPVFSVNEGDVPVSCELNYLSGGVKPSAHPGWVGQNWNLSVGGIVTRKVNGGVDEDANSQAALPGNSALMNVYSYLYNYGNLNNANYNPWYGNSFIEYYYENATYADLNKFCNLAPDEFSFTLPTGVSGSFYLNHLGQWVVQTKSPSYLAISVSTGPVTIVNNNQSTYQLTVNRAIYSITITDEKGYIYTFGNNANAIEFARGPRNLNPEAVSYNEDIVANAWHITQIQSPTGNVVNFIYQRLQNQYVQGVSYPSAYTISMTNLANAGGAYASQQTGPVYTAQVISPVYLSQITSRTFNVTFNISPTTELPYSYRNSAFYSNGTNYFNYNDLEISDWTAGFATGVGPLSVWYKLDSIVVNDITVTKAKREKYTFSYNNDPTQRLFLGDFRQINLTTTGADKEYHFTYNTTSLPPYNFMQLDQWGYYNGNPFPNTVTVNSSLLSYFAMNNTYAPAGILQTITYPTFGTTTFNYEPNDYSYVLQKSGDAINLVSQTGAGGGLRVASIVNTDNVGNSYTTNYVYKKIVNGSPSVSSGVLCGYNKIVFNASLTTEDLVNVSFLNFDDYSSCLDYTNGRDVVYSEVQEILPDGSYKIYDYSNSDNPTYMDEIPVNIYSDAYSISNATGGTITTTLNSSYSYPLLSHSSRELERGQLLSERDFNAAGILLKQTQNTYNSDPTRFNNYVRTFDIYALIASTSNNYVTERYFQADKIYTYFPYLQSTATTQYDQNGANPVTTTRAFTYDPVYRNKKSETYTASDGEVVNISYNYPPDNISGLSSAALSAQSAMVTANMTGILLEKITTRNGIQTEHERTDYNTFTGTIGNFMKPAVFNKSVSTLALEPRIQYNSYDPYGHLLEEQKVNDLKHAYLWGYNNAYPVADITGASYATANAYVPAGSLANPASDLALRTALNSVRTGLAGTAALVNTYTYAPLTGMTSQTDPTGKISYFVYDGLNRLSQVLDINSNVVEEFNYNYSFQGYVFPNNVLVAYYTPNNCSIYYTGVPYPYTVPAGKYTSTFSPGEANELAANDAAANGQTAANASGVCNPDIEASNTITNSFTVTFTNTTTGNVYNFQIPAGLSNEILGNVPAGTYNVAGSQNASTGTYVFQVGDNSVNGSGSSWVTFSNVSITTPTQGYLYVNPVGKAQ